MWVKYEAMLRAYSFTCPFGCFEYGFASEESALEAYCNHDCQGMKA